jgi:hypothetical protein
MITFELYGMPRIHAGIARVQVKAATVGAAVETLGRVCPALEGSVLSGARVHPAYMLSLNGERFVTDPAQALREGDALLLLAADVGG